MEALNPSFDAYIPSGLVVDAYATVHAFDNIFASNTDLGGSPTDTQVDALAVVSESNNLTVDGTLVGAGDLYANPSFDMNWYLLNASTAVNAGSKLASKASFIGTNPYAEAAIADTVNLDLGFHHANTLVAVSSVVSTVTPASYVNPGHAVVTFIVTPKDALGNVIGAGLKVTASLGASVSGATIGGVFDQGDGTYQVNVDGMVATLGQSDTIMISVEGAGGVAVLTAITSIMW